MRTMITITEENNTQLVDGRELHGFLEVGRDFTTWMKRMIDYGFEADLDYTILLPQKGEQDGWGGSNRTDYALTLDMAKEISMIQRTPKGKEARQYFIRVEKDYRLGITQDMKIAQTMNSSQLGLLTRQVEAKEVAEAEVKELKPKAEYVEKYLKADDSFLISAIAREVGVPSATKMNKVLHELGIQYKRGNQWLLYRKYADKDYTETNTWLSENYKGEVSANLHTKWTPKGRTFLHQLSETPEFKEALKPKRLSHSEIMRLF